MKTLCMKTLNNSVILLYALSLIVGFIPFFFSPAFPSSSGILLIMCGMIYTISGTITSIHVWKSNQKSPRTLFRMKIAFIPPITGLFGIILIILGILE